MAAYAVAAYAALPIGAVLHPGIRVTFAAHAVVIVYLHVFGAALALLWLATGVMALWCIRRGDVAAHRRWMMRNYALTLAAVTLRLYLPAAMVGGVELALAYPLVAWLCWLPNLLLAEWLVRRPAARSVRKSGPGFALAWRA